MPKDYKNPVSNDGCSVMYMGDVAQLSPVKTLPVQEDVLKEVDWQFWCFFWTHMSFLFSNCSSALIITKNW